MHSVIFTAVGLDAIALVSYTKRVQTRVANWPPKDIISENSWVLNLRKDLSTLSWLVTFAESDGVDYKILVLENEPEWIVAPRHQP